MKCSYCGQTIKVSKKAKLIFTELIGGATIKIVIRCKGCNRIIGNIKR